MNINKEALFQVISKVFILIFVIIFFATILMVLSKNAGTSTLNEIGGAVGGFTAPIVGILGALLVYATFEQQNIAIQQPIDLENARIDKSKKLILLDLKKNILPTLEKFLKDCIEFNKVVTSREKVFELADYEYTGLDTEIYQAVGIERLFIAFEDELFDISAIYRDVKYLRNIKLMAIYRVLNEAEKSLNPSIYEEAELLNANRETYGKNMLSIMQTVRDAIKLAKNITDKYSNNA